MTEIEQHIRALYAALGVPDGADCDAAVAHAAQAGADAARWKGVPWQAVDGVLFGYFVGTHPNWDDYAELHTWYEANKPKESA